MIARLIFAALLGTAFGLVPWHPLLGIAVLLFTLLLVVLGFFAASAVDGMAEDS
jgi:hypothetical protein